MWKCYRLSAGGKEYMGEIDLPSDCWGDELYGHMEEMGWIEDIDEFDVDGDNESVAVMCKDGSNTDFVWEYGEDR